MHTYCMYILYFVYYRYVDGVCVCVCVCLCCGGEGGWGLLYEVVKSFMFNFDFTFISYLFHGYSVKGV
ncbi:uncharacterized protein BDW43DRAFT_278047 [Aspergillus alliaceus]|uniref:uncharacterized protein n=1 Tax=Petromyces alliaceus TaxID=209559 RepID=UPI0012A51987|nr:uncharacterized protein BDW43DRAFT_278047 [Aspergillus alliaceus]KAB8232946.1 hypothetical protein BDW43DRAFT_278047 [Aspergillus alliaceus]